MEARKEKKRGKEKVVNLLALEESPSKTKKTGKNKASKKTMQPTINSMFQKMKVAKANGDGRKDGSRQQKDKDGDVVMVNEKFANQLLGGQVILPEKEGGGTPKCGNQKERQAVKANLTSKLVMKQKSGNAKLW